MFPVRFRIEYKARFRLVGEGPSRAIASCGRNVGEDQDGYLCVVWGYYCPVSYHGEQELVFFGCFAFASPIEERGFGRRNLHAANEGGGGCFLVIRPCFHCAFFRIECIVVGVIHRV